MLACTCDFITAAEYREAVKLLSDQIRIAKSFGAAVGIVFRATHPEEQTQPAEIDSKRRCRSCTPHIGRSIVEEGLRSKEEFDGWNERLRKTLVSRPACGRKDCCMGGFDL